MARRATRLKVKDRQRSEWCDEQTEEWDHEQSTHEQQSHQTGGGRPHAWDPRQRGLQIRRVFVLGRHPFAAETDPSTR